MDRAAVPDSRSSIHEGQGRDGGRNRTVHSTGTPSRLRGNVGPRSTRHDSLATRRYVSEAGSRSSTGSATIRSTSPRSDLRPRRAQPVNRSKLIPWDERGVARSAHNTHSIAIKVRSRSSSGSAGDDRDYASREPPGSASAQGGTATTAATGACRGSQPLTRGLIPGRRTPGPVDRPTTRIRKTYTRRASAYRDIRYGIPTLGLPGGSSRSTRPRSTPLS